MAKNVSMADHCPNSCACLWLTLCALSLPLLVAGISEIMLKWRRVCLQRHNFLFVKLSLDSWRDLGMNHLDAYFDENLICKEKCQNHDLQVIEGTDLDLFVPPFGPKHPNECLTLREFPLQANGQ